MSALDPSYIRSIRDGIINGNIEANNQEALPDGLVGLYDRELFPPTMKWKERKEALHFFLVFALAQKEISADFAAEILGDEWSHVEIEKQIQEAKPKSEEEKIKEERNRLEDRLKRVNELIQLHSKRFTAAGGGKYLLYHDRFRVYVLQKVSEKDIAEFNAKYIGLCEMASKNSLDKEVLYSINSAYIESYEFSLEYLSFYIWIEAVHGDIAMNEKIVNYIKYDTNFFKNQYEYSGSFKWTISFLLRGLHLNVHDDVLKKLIIYEISSILESNSKKINDFVKNKKAIISELDYLKIALEILDAKDFYSFALGMLLMEVNKAKPDIKTINDVIDILNKLPLSSKNWVNWFDERTMYIINKKIKKYLKEDQLDWYKTTANHNMRILLEFKGDTIDLIKSNSFGLNKSVEYFKEPDKSTNFQQSDEERISELFFSCADKILNNESFDFLLVEDISNSIIESNKLLRSFPEIEFYKQTIFLILKKVNSIEWMKTCITDKFKIHSNSHVQDEYESVFKSLYNLGYTEEAKKLASKISPKRNLEFILFEIENKQDEAIVWIFKNIKTGISNNEILNNYLSKIYNNPIVEKIELDKNWNNQRLQIKEKRLAIEQTKDLEYFILKKKSLINSNGTFKNSNNDDLSSVAKEAHEAGFTDFSTDTFKFLINNIDKTDSYAIRTFMRLYKNIELTNSHDLLDEVLIIVNEISNTLNPFETFLNKIEIIGSDLFLYNKFKSDLVTLLSCNFEFDSNIQHKCLEISHFIELLVSTGEIELAKKWLSVFIFIAPEVIENVRHESNNSYRFCLAALDLIDTLEINESIKLKLYIKLSKKLNYVDLENLFLNLDILISKIDNLDRWDIKDYIDNKLKYISILNSLNEKNKNLLEIEKFIRRFSEDEYERSMNYLALIKGFFGVNNFTDAIRISEEIRRIKSKLDPHHLAILADEIERILRIIHDEYLTNLKEELLQFLICLFDLFNIQTVEKIEMLKDIVESPKISKDILTDCTYLISINKLPIELSKYMLGPMLVVR
jgi:hypothetical protein